MAQIDELRELLHHREQLNAEFKALTRVAVQAEEEVLPARQDAPFFDFYKEKISHFNADNEQLFVAAEVKRRKIAEGEARLDRILTALVQKQQQFAQANAHNEQLSRELEMLEAKINDLLCTTDNARQSLACAHEREAPLKGLIEYNITQIVQKKSGVALLESQKALQDAQFAETSERSHRLVDYLARAQNDAGIILRQFQVPSDEQASLESLRDRAREQQILRREKERLAAHFARLIRDKASFLEQYKEQRGVLPDANAPRDFMDIINPENSNVIVSN